MRTKVKKKQVVLYLFETTDNANLITISVNPKEYFEKYKDKSINKKHKGIRIDIPGMSFDADAGRIMSFQEHETVEKRLQKKVQKQFQIKNGVMKITNISKCQSVGLNNKRYYFSDGIVAFPFGHPYLQEITKYEKEVKDKMQK